MEDLSKWILLKKKKKGSHLLFKELSLSSGLARRKEEAHCMDCLEEGSRAQEDSSHQRDLI